MTGVVCRLRLLTAVMLLAAAVLVPARAQAASTGSVPGSITSIAPHGFGDSQNSYAWAMAWFKGKLYVGTGRDVMCVENATSQFYFSFTTFYKTNPAPGVHCARNKYDLDLRAEIWQYTPSTGRWRMVYRAPADIPNPAARGKFVARDIAYRGMVVARDSHGRQALFVSGVTADEYIPALAQSHPPRLLRTDDGTNFHNIAVPLVVHRNDGYVDRRPVGFRGLQIWHGHLYVLASTALTGDGAVFRVDHPFSAKGRFTQVTPPNMHVFEMSKFDGHLWVGTGSFATGYGVYKTPSTSVPRHAPYRFTPVVTNGAGLGTEMVSVISMHPFRGHLYVGAVSWYSTSLKGLPAAELIRIGHNDQWDVVTGDPRPGPDGKMRYPISGLPAGFGNSFNSHLWRMTDAGGALYVGSLDWSWLLQDTKSWAHQWAAAVDTILKPGFGFDLWKSCDGVSWSPVTINAFGVDPDDFGVRTLEPWKNGFSLGTANHAHGTRIWLGRGLSSCRSPRASTARPSVVRVAEAPRNLLTDVQPGGTVVSWEPSSGDVRYRVERAQYIDAPVSLQSPSPFPSALPSDDNLPSPIAAGTPGSFSVQMPVLGAFRALDTTTRLYFVDRTRVSGVRYQYRVVAETGRGTASVPSNVQMVPDPRPPATVAQLQSIAPALAPLASIARASGDRKKLIASVAALARSADDDSVRELAYRLERRLRYENVAANPVNGG